ncbi:MAG TPA: hypothetical protein VFN40_09915 [Gemmatimonadales bacterium]|nr:hypothetical protein [Gemmatimonadales bacterium]
MSQETWEVPELGPSLGRLTDPAQPVAGPLGVRLDDIRLKLVTGVFELAGASRSFAAAGDAVGAAASLNRVAWLALWEKAVVAGAERITAAVNARLEEAAAESRYPRRKLRQVVLTPTDTRAIAARLGGGGAPFVAALDELEQAAHRIPAQGARDRAAAASWRAALTATARRLEAAWLALEEAAAREQLRWQGDVQRVHGWRLPRWPLWLLTVLVLGAAVYLGLVLGGYVPVPPELEGFAQFWWSRL